MFIQNIPVENKRRMKLSVFLGGYKKSNHATMDSQSQHSENIEYLKSEVGNLFNTRAISTNV